MGDLVAWATQRDQVLDLVRGQQARLLPEVRADVGAMCTAALTGETVSLQSSGSCLVHVYLVVRIERHVHAHPGGDRTPPRAAKGEREYSQQRTATVEDARGRLLGSVRLVEHAYG
jgi:hypothetical protein